MLPTTAGPRAVLLAALMVAAVSPLGVLTPAGGAETCTATIKPHDVEDYIQASSPLSEHFSVSQILQMVREDHDRSTTVDDESDANGVDAYVHDLGCAAHNVDVTLTATTGSDTPIGTSDVDMAVHFYDPGFHYLGEISEDADDDGRWEGDAPDRTRYVVVHLVDGPLMSGVNYDTLPPEPYSVQFTLGIGR